MKQVLYNGVTLVGLLIGISSCNSKQSEGHDNDIKQDEELFISVLEKHLNAVSSKDLTLLKTTMSPNGDMELILPNSEIKYSADEFIKFHEEWFEIHDWTFKTKILSSHIGDRIGVATTEILYEEPDRNGKPYFNRMIVSYSLEKVNGSWYIIKDHASSIDKTSY